MPRNPRFLLFLAILAMGPFLSGCHAEKALKGWALEFLGVFEAHPYLMIFSCLFICGLGVPLPEEFFLIMAGYVCFRTGRNWEVMAVITMFSILSGDSVTYSMGRILRGRITEFWLFRRFITVTALEKATDFLGRHGNKTIFAARFMPGIRMPTYLMCGILGVHYRIFFLYDMLAALISVPIQVYLSWRFGAELEDAIGRVVKFNRAVFFLVLGLATAFYVYSHFRAFHGRKSDPNTPPPPGTGDVPPPVDLPD